LIAWSGSAELDRDSTEVVACVGSFSLSFVSLPVTAMDVKIEDIYNDGFEVEVEAIKQERAQVKQAQKSPSKKQRSTDASKHDFKPQFIHHLPDAQQQVRATSLFAQLEGMLIDYLSNRPWTRSWN
jgi:hypothetical protein